MMNITIKIWQEPFNDLFYADINIIDHDKYLCSTSLEILLENINISIMRKLKEPE